MNPNVMVPRKWTFGDVEASQTVSVLELSPGPTLYVCTTFSVRVTEHGFTHQAKGSTVLFADADVLDDAAYREKLALQHMELLALEQRLVADKLSSVLNARAYAEQQSRVEAKKELEDQVGALSSW